MKARQWHTEPGGQLAGQGLDGDDDLRGKDRGSAASGALFETGQAVVASRHPDPTAWLEAVEGALRPATRPAPVATAANDAPDRARVLKSGGQRRLVGLAAVVAAVVVALGVTLVVRDRGTAGGSDVTHLSDGDLRVSRTDAGTTIAIGGPEEVAVGESAVFSAEIDGDVVQWAWVTPEARLLTDAPRVRVQASSAGVATVTLIAVVSPEELISVSHDLRVRDSSDR
jgi:hypothetical protein